MLTLLLLAGLIRFSQLGLIPLSQQESAEALAAWRLWQPEIAVGAVQSPAYFSFTLLLSQLAGFGDAAMRLAPAVFGLATIALPWLARARIGTAGALTASVLLAVSPLLTITARTAGGDAIAYFAVGVLALSLLRSGDGPDSAWPRLGAAAVALGLLSSEPFYTGLLSLLVTWMLGDVVAAWGQQGQSKPMHWRHRWRQWAAPGLVILLALGTGFLTTPLALSGVGSNFYRWLAAFGLGGQNLALGALLQYELPMLLALAGAVWAAMKGHDSGLRLALWLSALLVLFLLQPDWLANAPLATFPAYMLAGCLSQELWTSTRRGPYARYALLIAAGTLFVGFLLALSVGRYSRLVLVGPSELRSLSLVLPGLFLVLLGLYYFLTWYEPVAVAGMWLGIVVLVVYFQWGNAWHLTRVGANDPREIWVTKGTDESARLLARDLREISLQLTGAAYDVRGQTAARAPVLAWYLRDFNQLERVTTIRDDLSPQVLITAPQPDLAQAGAYIGAGYTVASTESPTVGGESVPLAFVRNRLFHERTGLVDHSEVILWVRADLVAER